MPHSVFISYSSQDAATARAVCAELEGRGVRCWIAPRNAVPGIPYARQLVDAINTCEVVLLVLSANANASRAVLNEIELATNRAKPILPFRIEDVTPASDLEFYIRSVQWLDAMSKPLPDAVADLMHALEGLITPATASYETTPSPEHNLPSSLTHLVGREDDVIQLEALLETSRLVTVTGTGGVGKTTCALAVAADRLSAYPDGAWFVNLASVGDGSLVPSAIAAAIGLHESQNRPIVDTLMTYLKSKRMLLLLDNCEHLVRAAANIVEVILQTCPHVTVLATTREALGLTGEQTYRLPPLAVPPAEALRGLTATEALSYSAVALFFDGAKRIDHAFVLTDESAPAVAEICRRLDGIALAIELAVARTKTIPVKVLAEKLDQRFRLLTEGSRTALPRQQTLRATIDWSYEFLSKPERTLFRALGTFAGGFTLDLVLALSTDGATNELDVLDRLTSLVEKSLLQAEVQDSGTRYRLLESVREFARERLVECGEMETAVHAHAQAFTHLAERLETEFETKPETTWRGRAEPELENFRVALAWAFGADGDPLLGQRMTAALRPAWFLAPSQGRRWVTTALERVQPDTPGRIVGRLELTAAHLDMLALKNGAAQAAARRALDRLLPLNDVDGVAMAQLFLGGALGLLGDAAEAEPMLQAALTTFRERGARREIGAALGYLGLTRVRTGDLDGSRPLLSEALETYRAIGALRPATHMALTMAEVEYQSGDAEAAIRLAEEALENDRRLLDLDSVVFDLCNLAAYLAALERWDESTSSAREALSLAREREIELGSGLAIQHLAAAAAMRALEADGSENELRARSARLIAYVDAQFEAAGYQRDYTDQQEYDRLTSALEKVLGNEVLALYARDGRTWTEERAAKESLLV